MLTIAWDVDDVLNNLMKTWLEYYCQKITSQFSYTDIKVNPPNELLNISLDKYLTSLDNFRMSDNAISMEPNAEVLEWMEQNGATFKHIALSATSQATARNGAFWVMKHFGKWINSYNIVPSYRTGETFLKQNETKKDFLQWIKVVDILIDDNEKNIEQAKELGIKCFLVSRPWNKDGMKMSEILVELNKLRGE